MSSILRLALVFLAVSIAACGHAHPTLHVPPSNPASFRQVQIGTVSVVSMDEKAATNMALQAKLREWQAIASQGLRQTVEETHAQIVDASSGPGTAAPVLSLTSEVVYGNRTLRWISYGGAGRGGVTSRLIATDPTGARLFDASMASDLAVGFLGGNVDKVFRKNIEALLEEYRRSVAPRS
ncbi:MAG: hypothetical protein JWN48_2391 [Myxococcaceae bacterium]|nr:hypothetical protein [Myxococcaceae bacterium]